MKIAVLADVHVHDVYGDYDFAGVLNSRTGLRATVRTLKDTVELTRIFNESYFAFMTALDDIVSRGIRHVVLVGDYSDDGQRTSVAGVVAILRRYTAEHGLSFLCGHRQSRHRPPVRRPSYEKVSKGRRILRFGDE